ncbi:MAG: N-acetyltransferase family protein [Salinigranum sp.]
MDEEQTREYWDAARCEGCRHCPPRCPRFVDNRGVPWLVRPYEPSDRERLLATYAEFAPDQRAMGLPPLSERALETWLDDLVDAGCNFVATSGDRIVGHAAYTPTDAVDPELAVFVHQDYQNRGIGTELCEHVVAAAAAADRDALVLEVEPGNRPAIRMYEALGFERVGPAAGTDDVRYPMRTFGMRLPLSGAVGIEAQYPPAFRV